MITKVAQRRQSAHQYVFLERHVGMNLTKTQRQLQVQQLSLRAKQRWTGILNKIAADTSGKVQKGPFLQFGSKWC